MAISYRVILITLKLLTLVSLFIVHVNYMLNAIHPQSVISFIGILIVLYSIYTTIVDK